MNDAHKEISRLHEHVSQLYQVIKELSEYVGWHDISNLNFPLDSNSIFKLSHSSTSYQNKSSRDNFNHKYTIGESLQLLNRHNDILVDDESVQASVSEMNNHSDSISCEEQVHRLSAQLTAAYSRIASLEDRLLEIRGTMEVGENNFYQCH
jgi:hypothetical protein